MTALQPGPTDTEFFERAGMEDTKVAEADKDDPAKVAGGKLLPEKARAGMQAAQVKPVRDED